MAIWQFTFHLIPRDAVERLHGNAVLSLAAFRPVDPETGGDQEFPNYWEGRSARKHASEIGKLLPTKASWSDDSLMFGDEQSNDVSLWDDDFCVRLDLRAFDAELANAIVELAAAHDLMLAMGRTGRLTPPSYERLVREIDQSRAAKFIADPERTLEMIRREQE